LVKLISIN